MPGMNNNPEPLSNDLAAKVAAWLNKSGYPLEMRVAQAFRMRLASHGWNIRTNDTYTDPKTGTPRERDLVAYSSIDLFAKRGISLGVELFVECKSITSPWVVLKR